MVPLSLLYLIRPFQRLNCWHKSLAHVCFVLQIIHCNIYGVSISIGKLSLTTKKSPTNWASTIWLPSCNFNLYSCMLHNSNRICCNSRMNCWNLHMGVFMIRVPKRNDLVFKGQQRTTLDICLSYIIIVVVDYCMPIDKMMSC
jgi:hypothetical protein